MAKKGGGKRQGTAGGKARGREKTGETGTKGGQKTQIKTYKMETCYDIRKKGHNRQAISDTKIENKVFTDHNKLIFCTQYIYLGYFSSWTNKKRPFFKKNTLILQPENWYERVTVSNQASYPHQTNNNKAKTQTLFI